MSTVGNKIGDVYMGQQQGWLTWLANQKAEYLKGAWARGHYSYGKGPCGTIYEYNGRYGRGYIWDKFTWRPGCMERHYFIIDKRGNK